MTYTHDPMRNPQIQQTHISATSQQTRFDPTEAPEIDVANVTIAVGDRELLVDAKLKLRSGSLYAFIGRYLLLHLPESG